MGNQPKKAGNHWSSPIERSRAARTTPSNQESVKQSGGRRVVRKTMTSQDGCDQPGGTGLPGDAEQPRESRAVSKASSGQEDAKQEGVDQFTRSPQRYSDEVAPLVRGGGADSLPHLLHLRASGPT